MTRSITCVALALILGGCDIFEIDDVVYERVIGQIQMFGGAARVEVPDTVSAGAAFQVRVLTYGGGCTRTGDTEVRISENGALAAELIPHDFEAVRFPPYTTCSAILTSHVHDVFITFNRLGEARITIRGRGDVTAVRTVVVKAAQ